MSDILIRGMEMPDSCKSCNFFVYRRRGYHVCAASSMFLPISLMECGSGRRDFCTLREMPDGRLVGADEAYRRIAEAAKDGAVSLADVRKILGGMPSALEK